MNWRAKRLLKRIGAIVPECFFSNGVPQIALNDLTKPEGARFDFGPFRGRIVLGKTSFNSLDISPFPHGPVRLTLVRWGREPEQCGKIMVGNDSELSGTSIVSYVCVTIGQGVLFGPNVIIMDCDGHSVDRSIAEAVGNLRMAPVVIEDKAWIGYGALIADSDESGHLFRSKADTDSD